MDVKFFLVVEKGLKGGDLLTCHYWWWDLGEKQECSWKGSTKAVSLRGNVASRF